MQWVDGYVTQSETKEKLSGEHTTTSAARGVYEIRGRARRLDLTVAEIICS